MVTPSQFGGDWTSWRNSMGMGEKRNHRECEGASLDGPEWAALRRAARQPPLCLGAGRRDAITPAAPVFERLWV